jgi:hypothetical protein
MKNQQGDVTLYDIVVTDRASGRRKVLAEKPPVAGQSKASEEVRRLEMTKRDPNLSYSIERHRPKRDEEITPQSLLTHKFRAY